MRLRAQRQKARMLEQSGTSQGGIVVAKARYQGQLQEYKRFCGDMGLTPQMDRVYIDGLGRVANGAKISINTCSNISKRDTIKAEPASRYFNNSEDIYRYAAKVTPISGYEDVFIHGDKTGFAIKDLDGKEHDNYSPKEFADILKKDPNYHGGAIRLLSCEAGAKGSTAAQELANNLGVEVLAPSDTLWINFDGNLSIGPDPDTSTGEWILFKPKR